MSGTVLSGQVRSLRLKLFSRSAIGECSSFGHSFFFPFLVTLVLAACMAEALAVDSPCWFGWLAVETDLGSAALAFEFPLVASPL